MKYIISYLSVFVLIIFTVTACSDIADDITTPEEVGVHNTGVLNSNSDAFHGKLLKDSGFSNCQKCHASTLTGGVTDVSCIECHSGAIVHANVDNIVNPNGNNFHGKFKLLDTSLGFSSCGQCHGNELTGGVASPSCTKCHNSINVHKEGIVNPSSDSFHGKYIMNNNWDLASCASCHGSNYAGGASSPTCNTCHNQTGGPEACNTCHGDFNDPTKVNPPKDVAGNTATTFAGVGAHESHLLNDNIATVTACNECHTVPTALTSAGHIDDTDGAELVFGDIAKLHGATPTYNSSTKTCDNTYCHGNFASKKSESSFAFAYIADEMVGNNFSPIWNKVDGTQAECGTCHNLPPTGHLPSAISGCKNCHASVVDGDGRIIDKEKHINGEINAFGN